MAKEIVEIPVSIITTRTEEIDGRQFFVVEGTSEVGIFSQWLNIDLKQKYDDAVQEYVLIFEPSKQRNKLVFKVIDLVPNE